MRNFFQGLKIQFKLLIAFGSLLLISASLIGFAFYSINRMYEYSELNERVNTLNANILNLNALTTEFINTGFKSEDFLLNGKSDLLIECENRFTEIRTLVTELDSNTLLDTEMAIVASDFSLGLGNYEDIFKTLVTTFTERGFQDYGLEGELRSAIHAVEKSGFEYDKALMLMLRRHEKDFFLRKDLKYLGRFNDGISEFIQSFDPENEESSGMIANVENYKNKFASIVQMEEQIGLNAESGLRGELSSSVVHNRILGNELASLIKNKNSEIARETFILLPILLFLQIIIGMLLMMFYSRLFTRAITEIRDAAQTLSAGSFPDKLNIRTRDEISETKFAFNNLIDRIRAAAGFAENLGNGNLSMKYDDRFNNDVLAKSIIEMQTQMQTSEEEREKINWANQGLAHFNDILRSDEENLEKLGDSIIRQLVKYMDANQGALFIIDENEDTKVIRRISTYAYERRKKVDQEFMIGEGLVGQSVQEKDTLFLTDIPNKYTSITSGLGHATPGSIMIVPLKINETIMGVVELASFKEFKKYEIEFVEKLSETIANILLNKSNNERNKKLFEEAQEKAQMLAHQEEELRQNTEELMATQEQMRRQRTELEKEIELLKSQLRDKIEVN